MSNPISTIVVQMTETTAGAVNSPPSGAISLYTNASGTLYAKNSAGSSTAVGGGGGGGSGTVTSISAGANMSFSTITTTGSIALASTITGTTLTTPVINGATSSGSTSIDFSGNSGTQKTTTGDQTIGSAGHVITLAGNAGMFWSPVNVVKSLAPALTSASVTGGMQFAIDYDATITGARFWWSGGGGALTVKCTLWNSSNSPSATGTVAVNAANIYTVTFGSPYTMSGEGGATLSIGAWENSGAKYQQATVGNAPVTGSVIGHHMIYQTNAYGVGDAQPTVPATGLSGNFFGVEPIYK